MLPKGGSEQLSSEEFRPEKYKDHYRDRLKAVVAKKAKGEEVTLAEPERPRGQVIDLMEALKASLEKGRGAASGRREPVKRRGEPRRVARRAKG